MTNLFLTPFLQGNRFNNNLFDIVFQKNGFFDFFNKNQSHFETKFPYQFLYRVIIHLIVF